MRVVVIGGGIADPAAARRLTLLRVFAGRFGGRDVTRDSDRALVQLARDENSHARDHGPAELDAHPSVAVVGRHAPVRPDRLGRIKSYLAEHPGLALAGAAYRGVGIPDCIESGERAAGSVVRSPATALS